MIWFCYEPTGYVTLGGVWDQIFLWCNKNGGVTLLTSQAYDKYQERYERDPTDLSQFLKMIGRLFSVRRLMKSVRILRVSMCVFVHAYTLVPI